MLAVDSVRAEERRVPRLITHPVTVAFGLANLYLLDLTGPVIASDHDLLYHLTGSASSIILPIVIYLVALSALFALLFRLAERPGALRVVIWSGAVLALPPVLMHMISNFSGDEIPDWLMITVAGLCGAAFLAACWRWRQFQRRFEAMQPAAATVMGFLAFSGIFIFAQLIWNAWEARSLNAPRALHQAQLSPMPPRPRIIWLLLDELSYQQVFETRFPGLKLPAFDRLAAQSTVFTHAVPAGKFTRYVIPTLFTGIPSDEIDVSAAGLLLSLRDPETGKWNRFRQHQTVFQDAIDAGYKTGIAGWYNPYCRIMPEVLDRCYWTYREATPAYLSPNRSLATDLVRPFRRLVLDIAHLLGYGPGSPTDETRDIRQHTGDYRRLLAAGDADLNDPSIDFLFLHMPVPHPFGFYDRETRTFSKRHTSYVDGLALADVYLAQLRQILEQQKQWDSTTLIVMGDHSWRTSFIWKDSESWTEEDEAASHGGQFDDRPAYLVKLPGQETPARIDQPFPAVATRALLDAVMQRRIQNAADLQAWVKARK
jgi:hypothetical protein